MQRQRDITVIIPTTAEPGRLDSLEKAIQSALSQENVTSIPLVYLNGSRHHSETYNLLSNDPRIRFFYNKIPSLPNAIHEARKCVDTSYFCFVDDDDLLIKNTLAARLDCFSFDNDIDAVISNGLKQRQSQPAKILHKDFLQYQENPLLSLMNRNWLASCGGLYKTSSIDESYFDPQQKYYEWSYVAFKLARTKKIRFLDLPTFVVNVTDDSLSQSESYVTELPHFLERLLRDESPPVNILAALKSRAARANNYVANYYLDRRMFGKALYYHLRCTRILPNGIFYQTWLLRCFKKYFKNSAP